MKVQRWVANTRGKYWIISRYKQCEALPSSTAKTPHELVLEALVVEEDVELEKEEQRSKEEDDAKGLDESTP